MIRPLNRSIPGSRCLSVVRPAAMGAATLVLALGTLWADSLAGVSACRFYASPEGGGDGTSLSTPFRVNEFWAVAQPGDTLCLLSGTYRSGSLITPPANLHGNPDAPITVRALYDGQVLVDGQGTHQPIRLWFNDWFVLEGLNACCSSASVVDILRSNHVVVRRVAAWDATDRNNSIFGIHYGDHNLLEDVAGWGVARKTYESSQAGDFTTIRRAWGRWEGSHVSGPKMTYTLAYNNYDMLVENSIGTWSGERMQETYTVLDYNGQPIPSQHYTNFDVHEPYGIFTADALSGDKNARARLLGAIAYVGKTDTFKANREVFFVNMDSVLIQDTAAVFEDGGTYSGKRTFGLYGLEHGGETNVHALNLTSLAADSLGSLFSSGWQQSNILQGQDATVYSGGSSVYVGDQGANLCHQYVDGALNDRPLWPWPMNRRIVEATTQSGHAPVDVTATVARLFGTLPPAGCLATDVLLPVAGHVTGAGGIDFRTDANITNPSDAPARAELVFRDSTDGVRYEASLKLGPHETLNFTDVVSTVFGRPGSIGSLRLETDSNGADTLRMTSRTYAKRGPSSFGQAIPGKPLLAPPNGESAFVTGLAVTDGARSNIGAVNTTETTQAFKIRLRNGSGAIIGTTPVQNLAPGSQIQWPVTTLFPDADGQGLLAEFRAVDGSSTPLAYGSLVDNFSGDPTFYPALRPAQLLYLPGVARLRGAGGTFFLSDISFSNPEDAPATVTVTFLQADRDNTSAPSTTFTLSPRETRQMDDGLQTLFGLSGTSGALKIQSSSPSGILVSERIYTPSSTTSGTVGQQVDPVTPEGFFSKGSLSGLRQDAGFRTNVGLFNPGPSSVTVTLTLSAPDGGSLGTASVVVPPFGYIQRALTQLFGDALFPSDSPLTVFVDAAGDQIFAFGTSIDNVSNDPTFSPGLF